VTSTPTLVRFRDAIRKAGDDPPRADLEGLLALAATLELPPAAIAAEVSDIHALIDGWRLREALGRGEWPMAASPDPLPAADVCHFVSPVRFGRRRADQFGHLVLTSARLRFRGALDVGVAWHEVESVTREARDVVVAIQNSRRLLRFSCRSLDDAVRATVLGQRLTLEAADPDSTAGTAEHVPA
jgi:hypothetical protein